MDPDWAAQEPVPPVSEETLAAFEGLLPTIQPAATSFNLVAAKTANVATITSGGRITYTITITNNGPDPASYVFFYDDYPAQMTEVGYLFSTAAISDGLTKPTWLLPNPIQPATGRVVITVTGILTSGPDITVTNTAIVTAFNVAGETNPANNRSQVQVGIVGYSPLMYIYLPTLFKAPPPPPITLVYHEDFSSSNPWVEFDANGCKTDNRDGRYWVDVNKEYRECLPPADNNDYKPERPYRTYGEFEVAGYHSEDIGRSDLSNAAYGIFINGQGGDNYYLFRIWPNNSCSTGGKWELIRKRSGNSTLLLPTSPDDCNPAIHRGGAVNVLRITHNSNLSLSVYVNGELLGTFQESSSNHLTGEATGVYVRSSNRDVRMKFDDFKVYRYN